MNSLFRGNVGINTTTAAFDLDVHGTANVGALTATSLSVDGQTLALATDLSANALRIEALYTEVKVLLYTRTPTDSLAKLPIGFDWTRYSLIQGVLDPRRSLNGTAPRKRWKRWI
jgi:hypothetical protein